MLERLRRRVYQIVEVPPEGSPDGGRFDWFDRCLVVLIVLNVVAVVLETEPSVYAGNEALFEGFEWFSVAVFSIEYLLRLWSCTVDPNYRHPILGRLRFALRPLSLIDLLAILPSLLPFIGFDLRFIRALRLLRLLRVLKLGRYSEAIGLLGRVLRSRRTELGVMFFVLTIVLICAAGAVYYAEHEAQPEAFSSIPAAMWWAVITLTTIGYGDIYPKTPLGKILGGMIAVCGIGLVALPTAIIASGFSEELQRRGRKATICPHCGKEIDGSDAAHHD
jgi:voltage-gated potassium channel